MSKYRDYFNGCEGMTRKEAIEHVAKTFGIKRNTAASYYSLWQNSLPREDMSQKPETKPLSEQKSYEEIIAEIKGTDEPVAPVMSFNIKDCFAGCEGCESEYAIYHAMSEYDLDRATAEKYYFMWLGMEKKDPEKAEAEYQVTCYDPEEEGKLTQEEVDQIIENTLSEIAHDEARPSPVDPEWDVVEKEIAKAMQSPPEHGFEVSMILKGQIFTYQLNEDGVIVVDGFAPSITQEWIDEHQDALAFWERYREAAGWVM